MLYPTPSKPMPHLLQEMATILFKVISVCLNSDENQDSMNSTKIYCIISGHCSEYHRLRTILYLQDLGRLIVAIGM